MAAYISNGNCGDADVGKLTITGGTFSGGKALFGQPAGTTGTATTAIKGGTYSTEVPAEYCAEGYSPKKNPDGTYDVHVHFDVKVEAKAATETEAGNVTYWHCPDCGRYFSDEALDKEIALESTVVPALAALAAAMAGIALLARSRARRDAARTRGRHSR